MANNMKKYFEKAKSSVTNALSDIGVPSNKIPEFFILILIIFTLLGIFLMGHISLKRPKFLQPYGHEPRTLYCRMVENLTFVNGTNITPERITYWIGTTSNPHEKVYYSLYKTDFGYYILSIFHCTPYTAPFECIIYARTQLGYKVIDKTIIRDMAALYKYQGNPNDIKVKCIFGLPHIQ